MPTLDWFFVAVLLVSLLIGAWRGLVFEVISLLSWIAAFVLAQWFAPDLALKLPMAGASEPIRYAAAFTLVFVLAVFAGSLLARLGKGLFSSVGLNPADRTLGALFGLLRGVLVLLGLTLVLGMTPLKSDLWWRQSAGVAMATAALQGVKPVLPEKFGKYLP